MQAVNISGLLKDLPDLDFREIGKFDNGSVGVFTTGPGESPWERHPDNDELLYVLSGEVVITLLTEGRPMAVTVSQGAMLIVPRGLWHKHTIERELTELYVTPGETEHSSAEDPRGEE